MLKRLYERVQSHSWWLVHNCVAHPLMGVIPCSYTYDFHDWTAEKLK